MGLMIATILLVGLTIIAALVFRFFLVPKAASVAPTGNSMGELDHKLLKKYDAANIHKQRLYTIIIALFIVMVFTYTLIEKKTYDEIVTVAKQEVVQVTEEIIDIPITEQPPPEPPKPKVSQVMKVVEDEEIIEEEPEEIEEEPDDELLFEDDIIEEEIVEEEIEPQVHMMVEQDAVPPGGLQVFDNRIKTKVSEYFNSNQSMLDGVSSGVIMLQFIVLENGQISNVQVLQGVDPAVDKIVVQQFKSLAPRWQPGKIQGQSVRQLMNYPILMMFE